MLAMGIFSVYLMNNFLAAFIAGGILIFPALAGIEIRIGRKVIFEESVICIITFIGCILLITQGLNPFNLYLVSPLITLILYLLAKYLLGVHKRAKQELREEME